MDEVREACGVFGIYAPGAPVAPLTFDGLFALQHRGQESAGMAVSDFETVRVVKDMGLVTSVFDARQLSSLDGHLAVGHVRYSTNGPSTWQNAQPVYRDVGFAGFALGHNGNLTNVATLESEEGMLPGFSSSDSDLVAELIASEFVKAESSEEGADLVRALCRVLPRLEGAYSFGLIDSQRLIGVRDPNGFRPLCLGVLTDEKTDEARGWVIASESPALDVVGATFFREIEPGEMVVIDGDGPRSIWPFAEDRLDAKLCIFEFVYFARPDTRLYGREVYAARHRMGEQLADEMPADADLVIGVPDSGVPAAQGFAARSGIPFGQGLVKNRYIGRTFIAPTEKARVDGVRRKLNPLRESVEGRSLIVVDDSIVRGTTTRQMVRLLREAGATAVHLRISSPPFRWPCYYGIDTPDRDELLAARFELDEIADHLGVDSLGYLSLAGLITAIGAPGAGFCSSCLTGEYPTAVPVHLSQLAITATT